jgi:hypothetical protein
MSYTTEEAANTYLGFTDVSENEVLQAERDLDDLALGAYPDRQTEEPFRKINPEKIDDFKADGLHRATCEQIRYRRLMGAEFFTRPQRKSGKAEGVEFDGTLPHIAPRALAILSDVGLAKRLGKPNATKETNSLEDIGWHLP